MEEMSFLWKRFATDPAMLLVGTCLKIAVFLTTTQVSEVHLLQNIPGTPISQKPILELLILIKIEISLFGKVQCIHFLVFLSKVSPS